jgi:hypothetical protein
MKSSLNVIVIIALVGTSTCATLFKEAPETNHFSGLKAI